MSFSDRRFSICIFACMVLVFAANSFAQNWPEFRGPTGDGVAASTELPTEFSDSTTKWKTAIHGKGWSSPVVWGQQVWLTTATEDGKKMSVIGVDLFKGKVLHDFVLFENANPDFCHPTNSYASSTPAIEEGRFYAHFGKYGTACIDTGTGKVLWDRKDFECNHFRGPASSPIIFENLLIVAFDGYDQQYVVGLNKETGETVWKQDREIDYENDNPDWHKSYGTGAIFEIEGQPVLVYPSASATVAYEPSTGKEIWRVYHGGMNASARPVMTKDGVVIVTNGMGKMFGVNPKGEGDITDSGVVWEMSKSVARKSSQLLVDGMMFMNEDKGILSCVDPATGKAHWRKRVGGTFAASPIYAGENIYAFSCEGKVHVFKPSDQYEPVAQFKFGDGFHASPAVVGNKLILRTHSELICVSK